MCQELLVETIKKTGLETDVSLQEAEKKLQDLSQEVVKCKESGKKQESVSE